MDNIGGHRSLDRTFEVGGAFGVAPPTVHRRSVSQRTRMIFVGGTGVVTNVPRSLAADGYLAEQSGQLPSITQTPRPAHSVNGPCFANAAPSQ
jgi:hypothetical protein